MRCFESKFALFEAKKKGGGGAYIRDRAFNKTFTVISKILSIVLKLSQKRLFIPEMVFVDYPMVSVVLHTVSIATVPSLTTPQMLHKAVRVR